MVQDHKVQMVQDRTALPWQKGVKDNFYEKRFFT